MSYKPHYIASFEEDSGLHTYYEPFLAPEKAFPVLEDAYCFRGTVLRRQGFKLLGRLRRVLTTESLGNIQVAGAGIWSVPLFTNLGLDATEPLAQFQPGTATSPITIVIAAPIGQTLTDDTSTGTMTIVGAGPITAASINYSTGLLTMTFTAAAGPAAATITANYYPCLPVMGLPTYEQPAINDEMLIASDTKYAYKYDAPSKQFIELPSTLAVTWQGSNSDFFWSSNYYVDPTSNANLFWATNSNMTGGIQDPIRYYNNATWSAAFNPLILAASNLYNAQIIVPYKDRLLFFNTWEGTTAGGIAGATNFRQRLRYSQNGTPLAADAFRQDIVGKGGYIDAPTSEAIVSAEFIKDTLIVKFERSSWKIVYTGNEVLPFVFQKINTELGSESKFSLVPFDRGVFSVGNYGITTDDSVNVERIDVQIPNTIFQFNNDQQGPVRVHGIRDYTDELVYWTYSISRQISNPQQVTSVGYPNKMLVYNYRNNTYAIFNDSFTCFGNYQGTVDLTWADLTWFTWAQWTAPWNSGMLQSLYPEIIAGNQHGFVEILNQDVLNNPSLFIKAINPAVPTFTVPQHNLSSGDIVKITNVIGDGTPNPNGLNDLTYRVNYLDADTISLEVFWTDGKFYALNDPTVNLLSAASIYIGDGIIAKFNGFTIATKRFAPFYEQGSQCRIGYIDFLLAKTSLGEITSSVFIDENTSLSMTDSVVNDCLTGSDIVNTKPDNTTLIPFQASQDKIWHRQFVQAIAQNFQIELSMSNEQLATESIAQEPMNLYALAFYLSPNARLTQ